MTVFLRPVYSHCSICHKTIDEIGGRKLTNTRQPVSPEQRQHIEDIIAQSFAPWFCQKCAKMVCYDCGEPYVLPMSFSYYREDGSSVHCAIFPFKPPCINPECSNRERNAERLEKLRKKR